MTKNQEEVEPEFDPFAAENIGQVHFIQLGRVYDVLMALYTESNPGGARRLLEQHAAGRLIGPAPFFDGTFITDVMLGEEDGEEGLQGQV